ncbi:MAG: hypothetical protein HZB53_02130 [Chloroflexi bacterium]|nr:hypothetical protein [Chloroflexota bacterium]
MHKNLTLSAKVAAAMSGAAMIVATFAGHALAASPAPGLLVKNYWGAPATINIADTEYTVPSDGQLFIALAPGEYDLSVNVDGADNSADSAQVEIPASQAVQMSYAATGVFFAPLTAPAASTRSAANQPAGQPPSSIQPPSAPVQSTTTPTARTGVTVQNYFGDTLTFNVMDTEYSVPANGQLFIALAPGQYTYSASVASTDAGTRSDTLTIMAGQTVTVADY